MKNQFKYLAYLFLGCLTVAAFASGPGKKTKNDWPQWRGPNRDGISKETGILKSWPEDGPKILWSAPSGDGYSGISVANGKLYTMYDFRSPLELWGVPTTSKHFTSFLKDKGYSYIGGVVNDSFDWPSWRNRTDKILQTFFPLKKKTMK